jgi:uncharacterized protein DUF5329
MPRKVLLLCSLVLAPAFASAAPSPAAKKEIGQLMEALSASGCQFQRNGSWYGVEEARAHLQRKYDYLLKKDQVQSAEQFVQRAASRSSMSGRAYRVKCEGVEHDASVWFERRLQELRQTAAPAPTR